MGRYFRAVAAGIGLLLIVGAVISYLAPLKTEVCDENPNTGAKYCTTDYVPLVALRAVGKYLENHNGAITGLATIVIAIFTATLYRATERLWKASESQLKEMAKTSDLAERQMTLAGRQADILEKQAAIARIQFIADKRPQLRIRHVTINSASSVLWFAVGQHITGSLILVNTGGTDARIIASRYRFFWTNQTLPMNPPLDENSVPLDETGGATLQAGESIGFPLRSLEPMNTDAHALNMFTVGWRLYVMGDIQYADVSYPPIERFMGFCRELTRDLRFTAVENLDYEYED
jgi:hypothetical protein